MSATLMKLFLSRLRMQTSAVLGFTLQRCLISDDVSGSELSQRVFMTANSLQVSFLISILLNSPNNIFWQSNLKYRFNKQSYFFQSAPFSILYFQSILFG